MKLPDAELSAIEQVDLAGQKAMAAQSRRGVERVVTGAGHDIQNAQPQAVIDAVREVIADAREAPKIH